MFRGFISALRTLTVLPVPGRDAGRMASALPWFPVAGLLVGLVQYGAADLFVRFAGRTWPEGTAVLLVVTGVILTGGLHMDGLADWADGFWGAQDRRKVLGIMKDPHVGAFAVLAVTCILLAKWACLTRLAACGVLRWVIAACVVSRAVQVDLLVALPYARPEGGTAAPFAAGADTRHLGIALSLALVLVLAVCGLERKPAMILVAAWLVARFFGYWCRRRVGGITGDLVGACSELVETGVLAAAAIAC